MTDVMATNRSAHVSIVRVAVATGSPGSLATGLSSGLRGGKGGREASLETLCKCLEGTMGIHVFLFCEGGDSGQIPAEDCWGPCPGPGCEPNREAEASRGPVSWDAAHRPLHSQSHRALGGPWHAPSPVSAHSLLPLAGRLCSLPSRVFTLSVPPWPSGSA